MKNPLLLYFALVVFLATSCKKSKILVEGSPRIPITEEQSREASTLAPDSVPADAIIYHVGTGAGDLTINGGEIDCDKNTLIKIKGGKYNTITIKNLIAGQKSRIYIKNEGQVYVLKAMYTDNIRNVTISGNNVEGPRFGIMFENIPYRAIILKNRISGVTLRNLSFENVSDYVIAGERSNGLEMSYNGDTETRNENFKILGCFFENAAHITFDGQVNNEGKRDVGFFKGVEIAYNVFVNTPNAKSACSFGNVQDYDIHHNTVDNLNTENNNHNGIFHMQGNGKFHDNKLTNYQGNAIRMWLFSRGTTPATNEIYNNICYNTRKYGGFELQAFSGSFISGKTTFANAKVYNNTVGKMNTSKDWEGQILDLYFTGGSLEYYNNLGFDLVAVSKPLTNMINNMSGTKLTYETNNRYFTSQKDAINNTVEFTSRIYGIGAQLPIVVD
jgi:hypothetical protein